MKNIVFGGFLNNFQKIIENLKKEGIFKGFDIKYYK